MMKPWPPRITALRVVGLSAIVLAFAGLYYWSTRPDNDLLSFRKIEAGVTWNEVEIVLGRPAGDITTVGRVRHVGEIEEHWGQNRGPFIVWRNENTTIVVYIDRQDYKVVGATFSRHFDRDWSFASWLKNLFHQRRVPL